MPGELKNLDFELFCTFWGGAIFSKSASRRQLQKLKSEHLEAESISGLFYRKVIGIYLLGKIADFIRMLIFTSKKFKPFFLECFYGLPVCSYLQSETCLQTSGTTVSIRTLFRLD